MDNANEKAVLDAAMRIFKETAAEITREEDAAVANYLASFTDPEDIKALKDPATREIFVERYKQYLQQQRRDQLAFDAVHAHRKNPPRL